MKQHCRRAVENRSFDAAFIQYWKAYEETRSPAPELVELTA